MVIILKMSDKYNFQWFMMETAKVAVAKNASRNDISILPEMGYIMWQCRDEQRMGGMPLWVENLIIGTLALIAKLSGKAKKIAPVPRIVENDTP